MARTARVALGQLRSWTVAGADGLPVTAAEEYLAFLRADAASPHTIQAYTRGLSAWWTMLEHLEVGWTEVKASTFGQFLTYLRSGDLPGTARVGAAPGWLGPASVQQRAAAVLSFYRWQAAANHVTGPYEWLYTSHGKNSRSRYRGFLDGIADHGPGAAHPRPLYSLRAPAWSRPPVLSPDEVQMVLAGCGSSSLAGSRDRLLFALLAETGMRLGEALSLRHCDMAVGRGDTPWVDVVPRQDHPHGARVKGGRHRRIFVGDDLEGAYSARVWALVDAGIDLDVEDLAGHWLFVNTDREPRWSPLRPETVYGRVRSISRAQPELPKWSPHWLRHTHATALLLSGCPIHVVQRRLGHADVTTTLNTYGWVTEDAQMRTLADWKTFTSSWKGFDGV